MGRSYVSWLYFGPLARNLGNLTFGSRGTGCACRQVDGVRWVTWGERRAACSSRWIKDTGLHINGHAVRGLMLLLRIHASFADLFVNWSHTEKYVTTNVFFSRIFCGSTPPCDPARLRWFFCGPTRILPAWLAFHRGQTPNSHGGVHNCEKYKNVRSATHATHYSCVSCCVGSPCRFVNNFLLQSNLWLRFIRCAE